MAIRRWAPFSAFTSLEREMQDMLDRFTPRAWSGDFEWRPRTDMYREDGDLVVRAEIPGIDPTEGLNVEVEKNVLHITGEKRTDTEVDDDDRYLRECHYGSFRRDVLLPEGVSADDITATVDHGVLMVRVPLPSEAEEEAQPKAIKVDVGRDSG